jgi:putrescine transport system permease protein
MSSPQPLASARTAWWQLWFQVFTDLFRFIGVLGRELRSTRGRYVVVALPMLWLLVFFVVPFLIVLRISFATPVTGAPPYSELLASQDGVVTLTLSLKNYLLLLSDPLYVDSYLNSIQFASISTLAALLIGYPIAYGIARARPAVRLVLLVLVILPFWTSSLLRTYAMIGILRTNGVLNQLLLGLGVIDQPLQILHTNLAVYIGITYNYLPFMILPLTANLMRLDFTLLQAAADLGARPWRAFLSVTLPLSLPGIVAGSLLVLIPAVGEYVIPTLLGGPDALAIGKRIWDDFFFGRDYPLAASVAVAMLVLIVVPMLVFEYVQDKRLERDARRA